MNWMDVEEIERMKEVCKHEEKCLCVVAVKLIKKKKNSDHEKYMRE